MSQKGQVQAIAARRGLIFCVELIRDRVLRDLPGWILLLH
jgi:hypothetical protein